MAYDKLDRIPKRRIHQAAQRFAQLHRYFLRRKRQHRRQRHNGEEIQYKHRHRIPPCRARHYPQRHKHKQDINVVAQQRDLRDGQHLRRPPHEDV